MGRWLVGLISKLILGIAYWAHKAEGLNALFLILPARLIIPTLRKQGARIGDRVEMHSPIHFHNVSEKKGDHYINLSVGTDCYFGKDVFLDLADKILIEDKVTISMRATLLTHTHTGKSPLSEGVIPPSHAPVVLRSGCYIGAGAIILPGVEIGEEAIVGAGAVVTKDVHTKSQVVGVPAR